MRILLIEDDPQIARNIKDILLVNNYLTDLAVCGEDGLYQAEIEGYDVIVLDWILPDVSGIEVCKILRGKNIFTPILMLTSKVLPSDKVLGLDAGADDYLTKPFIKEELLARIKALIRRKNGVSLPPILIVEDLRIDTNTCRVERGGKKIELAPKEYSLLEYLTFNQGKVLERGEILEHVWGETINPFSNTVDVHIRYLREKIDSNYRQKLIKTVKGKGYLLCRD